jgi:D-alanyl-D-alanine carboxypeptidase
MSEAVTITADQKAVYDRAMQLLSDMNSNPVSRKTLEQAVKVVRPDVETEEEKVTAQIEPHLKPVSEKMDAVLKRFEEEDARRAADLDRQVEADLNAGFDRLRQRNYTEDGIEKIKQIMVDRKVADPDVAAAYFEKMNPPAQTEGAGWTPQNWDLAAGASDAGTEMNALFSDEDGWADRQASKVLNEIRVG